MGEFCDDLGFVECCSELGRDRCTLEVGVCIYIYKETEE